MLLRLLIFSPIVLLLTTSFQFIEEITRCIHFGSVFFCNLKLPYSKVVEQACFAQLCYLYHSWNAPPRKIEKSPQ